MSKMAAIGTGHQSKALYKAPRNLTFEQLRNHSLKHCSTAKSLKRCSTPNKFRTRFDADLLKHCSSPNKFRTTFDADLMRYPKQVSHRKVPLS